MILALDIGNTSISAGCFENGKIVSKFKLNSDKTKSADEYAAILSEIFRMNSIDTNNIEGASLLSVVPTLTHTVKEALEKFSVSALVLGSGIKTGVNIRVESPALLGSDIVAAAAAALKIKSAPIITVDYGTATTFSVINESKQLCGCVIAPGVKLSLDSLSASCAQLCDISLEKPEKVVGTNTSESMLSGVVWGSALMTDGFIDKIKDEYGFGDELSVIATGGLSSLIVPLCKNKITIEKDLTLKGLYQIYIHNSKK